MSSISSLPHNHKKYVSLLYRNLLKASKKAFPSASKPRRQYIKNEIIEKFRVHMNENDFNKIAILVNDGNLHLKRMIISIDKPFISESIKSSGVADDYDYHFQFQNYGVESATYDTIKENLTQLNDNTSTKVHDLQHPSKESPGETIKKQINSKLNTEIDSEKVMTKKAKVQSNQKIPEKPIEMPKEDIQLKNTRRTKIKRLIDISEVKIETNSTTLENQALNFKLEKDSSPSSVLIKQFENESFNVPKLKSKRSKDEDDHENDPVLPKKYMRHAVKDQCTVLVPENVK